jgi:hypothetical protein
LAKPHYLVLVVVIGSACGPPSSEPAVQSLLDSYAPSLRIGGHVTAEARRRYALRVAPYAGYRDASFTAGGGLSNLTIWVDEYVDDGDPHVSPQARIKRVSLSVAGSVSVSRLIMRIDSALGTPATGCYRSVTAGRFISRYWSGKARVGVRLVVRLPDSRGQQPRDSTGLAVGSGAVMFGAEQPPPLTGDDSASCSAGSA